MNFTTINIVARKEFYRILGHPLIIVIGLLIVILEIVNCAGGIADIQSWSNYNIDGAIAGLCHIFTSTGILCTFLGVFIGVTSLEEERWDKTLSVLLTKPLYRRDIVLGKMIGITASMLLVITAVLLSTSLLIFICYREPVSFGEFAWRITVYVGLLTITVILAATIAMFTGLITKNFLGSVAILIIYFYADWLGYLYMFLGNFSMLSQHYLYFTAVNSVRSECLSLFCTSVSFNAWLAGALPYIGMMALMTVALVITCSLLFSREDI